MADSRHTLGGHSELMEKVNRRTWRRFLAGAFHYRLPCEGQRAMLSDMSDDYGITGNHGFPVPAVAHMPELQVHQLNELAHPLGHSVTHDGEFFRIRPTGSVDNHQCRHVTGDFDDARHYLERRSDRVEWQLDMEDSNIQVDRIGGVGIGVRITNIDDGQCVELNTADGTHTAGVGGPPTGLVESVFVLKSPPNVGRWYR